MPDCPSDCPPLPANIEELFPKKKAKSKPTCDDSDEDSPCHLGGRRYYSIPGECPYESKYDPNLPPFELISGTETWCNYGIRIWFTHPESPVRIEPEIGCPIGMTVSVQLRNEANIIPDTINALCITNMKTDENLKGESKEFCMPLNMCLSQFDYFRQTYMFQLCLVPTGVENKDVKFKVKYMNLTILPEDVSGKDKEKEMKKKKGKCEEKKKQGIRSCVCNC